MDKNSGNEAAATCRLYSDVLKADPSPTWLRIYQKEDEEDAVKRAIKELAKVTQYLTESESANFIMLIYQPY